MLVAPLERELVSELLTVSKQPPSFYRSFKPAVFVSAVRILAFAPTSLTKFSSLAFSCHKVRGQFFGLFTNRFFKLLDWSKQNENNRAQVESVQRKSGRDVQGKFSNPNATNSLPEKLYICRGPILFQSTTFSWISYKVLLWKQLLSKNSFSLNLSNFIFFEKLSNFCVVWVKWV